MPRFLDRFGHLTSDPIVAPPPRPKKTEPLVIDQRILRELAYYYEFRHGYDLTIPRSRVEQAARQITDAMNSGQPIVLKDQSK